MICVFQNQPPEQRYATQLEQLEAMGFVNRDANIRGIHTHYIHFVITCTTVLNDC